MKKFLFFLFLLQFPILFSLYGTASFSFEKSWTITGDSGSTIDMNATFLVNNTEQHLTSLYVSKGEFVQDGENIFVHYKGKLEGEEMTIVAKAKVITEYEYLYPQDFSKPVSKGTGKIHNIVSPLIKDSFLSTLLSLSDWVNGYITYDLAYADISNPYEVLELKKGVCIAYSNLFRELLNDLNLEHRGISGYVVSEGWQFHSWVEVKLPSGEWLSVDPTFGEVGILSSEHIKSYKYDLNNTPIDVVSSSDGSVDAFTSEYSIVSVTQEELDHQIKLDVSFSDNQVYVDIRNNANEYAFVPYTAQFPEGWGKSESKFLLIEPKGKLSITYKLDTKNLEPNYQYNIPFIVSVFGQGQTFEVSLSGEKEKEENTILEGCPLTFFLFLIIPFYWGTHD